MAKIMIIDDDAELAGNMAAFLQREGHAVSLSHTTAGAVATLAAAGPDLLILDMMFPENPLGGLDLAKEIRDTPALARLPIILLTAVDQHFPMTFPTDPKQDCRPIQDFIEKPVALKELLSRINEVLNLPARGGPANPGRKG